MAYIASNRIFLPKHLHDVINHFSDPLRQAATDFQLGLAAQARGEPRTNNPADHWLKASATFKETIMPMYEQLCAEMQEFIGLEKRHGDNAKTQDRAREPPG